MIAKIMNITKINNFFSDIELEYINQSINQTINFDAKHQDSGLYEDNPQIAPQPTIHRELSRIQSRIPISDEINNRLKKMCSELLGFEVNSSGATFVRYSNLYGNPNLPPHFDHDSTSLVIDYQLNSNTFWDLGIDLETYPLENNSALMFNPNKQIHWRPHKTFNNEEYIDMIFFRFYDLNNKLNHENLNYSQDHDIFKEVKVFRDSLI
jgi:hypothetical protein